jgi:alkaline phosphatase D
MMRAGPAMPRALRSLLLATLLVAGVTPPAGAQGVSIMHGFADQSSMTLWVQTERAARVTVDLAPESDPGKRLRVEGATQAANDFAAALRLAGLDPGTRYRYTVLLDGKPAAEPGRFATQALWQFRTDPPTFTVAFGSCFYVNDRFDRPGPPWGAEFGILDAIAARAPDLMLWLGDNVYFREPEWTSAEGMSARYRAARTLPELRRLARATSHVAIWDDHDYGPNDADGSFTMKGAALEAFKRYWPNPSHGLPGVPGVFGMVTYGDVDFFLLDNRFHRYPNRYPPTPEKAMLGRAQLEWLKQALVYSRAPFKIVVAGGQLWNKANRFEAFHNYPAEQSALADWLLGQRIPGVVFLSGDRHIGGLWRIERPGTYPLYEFTSSPLTAGPVGNPSQEERENPDLVPGTLLAQRNFGMLRLSGPRNERVLTLEAYASDGKLLWQRSIAAAELR